MSLVLMISVGTSGAGALYSATLQSVPEFFNQFGHNQENFKIHNDNPFTKRTFAGKEWNNHETVSQNFGERCHWSMNLKITKWLTRHGKSVDLVMAVCLTWEGEGWLCRAVRSVWYWVLALDRLELLSHRSTASASPTPTTFSGKLFIFLSPSVRQFVRREVSIRPTLSRLDTSCCQSEQDQSAGPGTSCCVQQYVGCSNKTCRARSPQHSNSIKHGLFQPGPAFCPQSSGPAQALVHNFVKRR